MTEKQKRLRKETRKDSGRKNVVKVNSFEEFPYTEEQYENKIVFGKIFYCFNRSTLFTVWIKSYFSDRTQSNCVIEKLGFEEVKQNYNWIMLFKLATIKVDGKNSVVINLVRRYECTSDEYFENLKNKKSKHSE